MRHCTARVNTLKYVITQLKSIQWTASLHSWGKWGELRHCIAGVNTVRCVIVQLAEMRHNTDRLKMLKCVITARVDMVKYAIIQLGSSRKNGHDAARVNKLKYAIVQIIQPRWIRWKNSVYSYSQCAEICQNTAGVNSMKCVIIDKVKILKYVIIDMIKTLRCNITS